MIVFPDDKILFIHIPKNGGGALLIYSKINNKNWGLYKSTHTPINKEIYKKYKNWKIVAIIRNSYERIVSLYRFRCLIRKTDFFNNFEDFVLNFEHKELLYNQLNYIKINEKVVADCIIYDKNTLTNKIANIFKDKEYISPIKNKVTHYHGEYDWKSYYTEKSKKEVEKYCQNEIDYFNFKF